MTIASIRQAIEGASDFFAQNPAAALSTDKAAVAVVEQGLRCRADGPDGAVLISDMPKGVGGNASAPTPGWFMRAALANCDATVIAMRAAQLGVVLSRLEVAVDSQSDDRGLFDLGANVPAGPLSLHVRVSIAADGKNPDQLREIVEWAEAHSPVGDAMRRAMRCTTDVEVA